MVEVGPIVKIPRTRNFVTESQKNPQKSLKMLCHFYEEERSLNSVLLQVLKQKRGDLPEALVELIA